MTRARLLKPGFFLNEQLAELPYPARILFEALWCIADRAGRLEDRPKRIKHEALPYDDEDVDDLLRQLHDAGFIVRYSVGGARYIQVVNFSKHQSPHIHEAKSVIPAPEAASDEYHASTVQAPYTHDTRPSVPIAVPIPIPNPISDCAADDEAESSHLASGESVTRADAPSQSTAPLGASTPGASGASGAPGAPAPSKPSARKKASQVPTAAPTDAKPRPVNAWWDALVEVFGYEPRTPGERSKWGKAVKDIKDAHATAEDIHRAKANYDAAVEQGAINWTLTPTALAAHLGELLQAPRAPIASRSRMAAADPTRPKPPTWIPASQSTNDWSASHDAGLVPLTPDSVGPARQSKPPGGAMSPPHASGAPDLAVARAV